MSTMLSLTKLPSRSKRTAATRLKLTELRIANLTKPQAGVAYFYDTVAPSLAFALHQRARARLRSSRRLTARLSESHWGASLVLDSMMHARPHKQSPVT